MFLEYRFVPISSYLYAITTNVTSKNKYTKLHLLMKIHLQMYIIWIYISVL